MGEGGAQAPRQPSPGSHTPLRGVVGVSAVRVVGGCAVGVLATALPVLRRKAERTFSPCGSGRVCHVLDDRRSSRKARPSGVCPLGASTVPWGGSRRLWPAIPLAMSLGISDVERSPQLDRCGWRPSEVVRGWTDTYWPWRATTATACLNMTALANRTAAIVACGMSPAGPWRPATATSHRPTAGRKVS